MRSLFLLSAIALLAGSQLADSIGAQAATVVIQPYTVNAQMAAVTCLDGELCYGLPHPIGANSVMSSPESKSKNIVNLTKAPSISSYAEADLATGDLGGTSFTSAAISNVTMDYYFQVLGAANAVVPVSIQAAGTATVTGGSYNASGATAYTRLTLDRSGQSPLISREIFDTYGAGSTGGSITRSFDISGTYNLLSGVEYHVQMVANASASILIGGGLTAVDNLTAYAALDPFFAIDPAYKNFTLAFSDGIRNSLTDAPVSAVPLPDAAPMFGTGLLALAGAGLAVKRQELRVTRQRFDFNGRNGFAAAC